MKVEIQKNINKGRGIFAGEHIKVGQVIERCELLFIKEDDVPESLEPYVYAYRHGEVALALGNGSLYNHSDHPNSEFYFNYKKKNLIIRALKDISQGEEITVNYGYDSVLKKRFNIIN